MKNAFSATEQKSLNLPEIRTDEINICHAFLKIIPIRDSLTSESKYCAFLHNTMQEFFSALWLVENPYEIEKVLKLCKTEENQHMRQVLLFLCGLLGEHNNKLLKCLFSEDQMKKTSECFIEKLLDTFLKPQSDCEDIDLLYVCQCLYELQSSNACLMFLEKMKHQLDIDVNLDPHQSCALSYVISQSRDKEVHLNLENCTVSDTGMIMILSCSPQIRLKPCNAAFNQIKVLLQFIHKVSVNKTSLEDERMMRSHCCCNSLQNNTPELGDALLDLCSHVKDYETQTGRSLLPALQSIFQSSPEVWSIDLSKRKTFILLEVLKLQTEKKPVELSGWTDEESEVMSFLQCLPFISQLGFRCSDENTETSAVQFLRSLMVAAESETSTTISSLCSYKTFPFQSSGKVLKEIQCNFLLDLYSHVKDCETQTGRILIPALQSVYQTAPDVWSIDLSKRKTSILLEVLKLQTEKKPVELRGWTDEESEVMSFLKCLPYISQLRCDFSLTGDVTSFVLALFIKAAESETQTGDQMLKRLISVCKYTSFPYEDKNCTGQSGFLLDLCSHVKDYETQTGRSFLPALQSVYQTAPDVWSIDLSKRKTAILLEVLKLQTEKKPVELRGWTDEESEVMSFLQCLPFISQLRFDIRNCTQAVQCVSKLFIKAAETETQTGDQMLKQLTSVCSYTSFPYETCDNVKQSDFLLVLCSKVKDYETQTGRSLLPALQSVYIQSSPDVWIIDLSKRKTSILEVFKFRKEKRQVKLKVCPDEESEVMSFLQCLPYMSKLSFVNSNTSKQSKFLLRLFIKAAETKRLTGEQMQKLLTLVWDTSSLTYLNYEQSDFLLDLYSRAKDCETQTGRTLIPALKPFFQALSDVWIIDLSERKTSILLEVLKLQTEKKPVELRGWTDEESEVMRFLRCLPFIAQLRFDLNSLSHAVQCVSKLFIKAAETETQTGDQMLKLLTSVCSYTSFPNENIDSSEQSEFLLDLYSHVKVYETQTGRSLLPALQSVYQSSPDVWIIDLSKRKTSILLEVLKLQTEKKPVELRGWTDEESEVMSFLQCLPYISQLSGGERCVLSLFKLAEFRQNPELVNTLLQALDFNLSLEGILPSSTCRFVGGVLHQSADKLTLTVRPQAISLRGTRLLFRHITNIQTLRLSGYMVVRTVRALRSTRVPVSVNELSVDLNDKRRSDSEMSRVLSSLASLLRLWTVQCLNLSDCRMKSLSLILLLSQQSPVTLRLSKQTLQMLAECVYEAQDEEMTSCFLQKVGRDLTPCALSWETLHYFLQHDISHITVDLKESDMSFNIREILPFLNRIHFQQMNSSVMMSLMREIYESRSSGFVSGLLSSVKNCINLQNRALDSVHCAALRFILQHCTAVTLDMLWTSIPEEELESFLPLLSRVSCLRVDRVLLLRMLHCSSSDVQQEASAVLLSALLHKLDFSCCSAMDLTEDTPTQTLQLTTEDCRVMSTVIQRVYRDTHTLTQLNLHDCQMNTAGIDQLFTILHSVKLQCGKSMLLQFLSHVDDGKAECLSRALGEEVDLSQTHLDLQVCRGLALVLEHSEGLTELDLSQCHLTDQSLDVLLPNLHKAQNIDFSGNNITDAEAQKIYSIVSHDSNVKTVRLFKNRITSRDLFNRNPRFEIW
ncbi:uncharacterized protein LOC130425870 [Triplophysa dalaica]|uniref:uncharacterized protein LOC130425870 n=1 Tax=Triplophysa dalaica TaxID=1582913 RepID=UPI0024DFE373|nr:uncharacterized protein LOC130425870 [Triplophysa dalaica]XP_056608268.1 uncharacterized protein LOC130425870 [Triplophysa dalaica]XP_056608269.1 uncharacterized protein LOC130425870 [Triplophysa dalaica]XP_056608270.1 uncharacterized protein LOC130425870 [Triplophysa dalaica]XP_056608271.1 uncharacterized protein LOC130425870 [Triplophysa dalaica]